MTIASHGFSDWHLCAVYGQHLVVRPVSQQGWALGAQGPFVMPEGDALDEMHLPSLSQKVQPEEDEGCLPLESTSINAGCGRYGLASSSLSRAPWARL